MYVVDFEFANKRLSDFGCVPCVINGSSGVNEVDIGCNITFNTIKNNHTSKRYVASSAYDDVYTTSFEICKNVCGKSNTDIRMTPLEVEAIISWLNRREYHKFKVYNSFSSELNVCYFGSFKSIKPVIIGEDILGISVTFEADTPYAVAEEVVMEYELDGINKIRLYPDGDEYDIVYPKTKITCLSDGDLTLYNDLLGNYIRIDGCINGETLTLDGNLGIVYSDKREQNEIANSFNYEYFSMTVNDSHSENTYSSTLPCKLTISYRPIKKVMVM